MGFKRQTNGKDGAVHGGILRRLVKDVRANVLFMAAAVAFPLTGVIGAAVDFSRYYLTKTRLQHACDAGVLAGRKVMTTQNIDATVEAETRKFVNFNFPQRTMQTAAFQINPTTSGNRVVNLTLTTTLPATITKIFGHQNFNLTVNCTAREDFVNTDVMLVLDTTLSMNCLVSEASGYCASEKTNSKMDGLRDAVAALYDALKPAQNELEANGLRLRYAIVPYSMTVNVGNQLRALNTSYLQDTWNYQQNVCVDWDSRGRCTDTEVQPVSVPHDATWYNNRSTSGFCVEERETVTSITANSGYSIPSNAYDLDVDLAPNSNATRWKPYDPAAASAKSGMAGISDACPKQVRLFDRFADKTAMTNWLSTMTAGGFTYHDSGMVWGARIISPTGLWGTQHPVSNQNPDTFNNFPVNRHLIFMTDGYLMPDLNTYSAWGIERYDERVTGNGNSGRQNASHLQRFRMMCNKIKSMNVTIWVISFGAGSGLTTDLQNCASSSSKAAHADNSAALIQQFQQIGQSIGALRLAQ